VPARTARGSSAIEVAEARFPGTAAVFDSELWSLFKGARPSSLSMSQTDTGEISIDRIPTTGVALEFSLQASIDALNEFQALEFVVLLATTANAAGILELRDLAQCLFVKVAERLVTGDQLRPFASELRVRVNDLFKEQTGSNRPP
jgi:hypothetical protein